MADYAKKIKVLYDFHVFLQQNYGGVSRYYAGLIKSMKNVSFALPVFFSENQYLKDANIKTTKLPSFLPIGLYTFCGFVNRIYLLFYMLGGKYDIYHPTGLNTFFSILQTKPIVITVHDMIFELMPDEFPELRKSIINKAIKCKRKQIAKANHIIAISKNTKQDILKVYPHILESKITVVHHGCVMETVEQSQNSQRLVEEKYILYVGARGGYKNFQRMLEALAPFLREQVNVRLVCTGADFNGREKKLIESLNIEKAVVSMLVSDDMMGNLYSKAELFIYPSIYEGFGVPLLEAFHYGTPACLSNASCFPEIADNAAVYFDPYNREDIRTAVESIFNNSELRTNLINRGKERLKLFSMDKMIEETENVYKLVLSK